MSLRRKTLLIISGTIAAMIAVLLIASILIIKYGVQVVENNDCRKSVDSANAALQEVLSNLKIKLYDWACWDDTYRFVSDRNQEYIDSNLTNAALKGLELNFIIYVDPEAKLFYAKGIDLADETPLAVPQSLLDLLTPGSPLLSLDDDPQTAETGILNLPEGPLLFASRPILTSNEEGPARGTILMAFYLSPRELAHLSEVSHLVLSMSERDDPKAPSDFLKARDLLSDGTPLLLARESPDTIAAYAQLEDFFGEPAFILKVESPRKAFMEARISAVRFTWLILVAGIILGAVTLTLLERLVLSRLSRLSKMVSDIATRRDLSARVSMPGKDELAVLGCEINGMLSSLERSEDELKSKSGQLHTLIENQGEGIVIVNTDDVFTFANPAACEILGVGARQLVGRRTQDFTDADNLRVVRTFREECRTQGKCSCEYEAILASGERRNLLVTATPRLERNGEYLGTFEVFRDVTELKRAEKLQASLEVKAEFLSMISHELRTPLVPIIGYSELILSGTFGDVPRDFREPLETIYSRAGALRNLIDDILQLSHIQHRTLQVRNQPIEVSRFLADAIKPFEEIDQGKPISIKLEAAEFTVSADPERLRQVIENLIENSIKYSKEEVEIVVRALTENGNGKIEVSDNGIGIAADKIPYIFERFYQVEDVHTRSHQGAGLGLAIAKELVEKMGGSIAVESESGVGSTFTVSLQLAPSESGRNAEFADSEALEPHSETSPGTDRPGARTVLVIDDDPYIGDLLRKMLGEQYDVRVARSTGEGLNIVRKSEIDLILLDWMLPGADGLSLLVSLKSDDATREIPVVFVTGKAEAEVVEQGIQAGASGFITKPFERKRLLESVEAALNAPVESDQS